MDTAAAPPPPCWLAALARLPVEILQHICMFLEPSELYIFLRTLELARGRYARAGIDMPPAVDVASTAVCVGLGHGFAMAYARRRWPPQNESVPENAPPDALRRALNSGNTARVKLLASIGWDLDLIRTPSYQRKEYTLDTKSMTPTTYLHAILCHAEYDTIYKSLNKAIVLVEAGARVDAAALHFAVIWARSSPRSELETTLYRLLLTHLSAETARNILVDAASGRYTMLVQVLKTLCTNKQYV